MKKSEIKVNAPTSILGHFNGKNKLLTNVHYLRPHQGEPDVATVIYKDMTDESKHVMEIENPLMRFYLVKEEYRNYSFYPDFMDIEKCDTLTVPYAKLLSVINMYASPEMKSYVKKCRESRNFYSMNILHHTPVVLGTDFPYHNYFRIEWALNYADPNIKTSISKQFLDIEVDSINIKGMPQNGDCPINAVTVVDDETNTSFTFLLRDPNNPQIQEFEDDIPGFIKECHEAFDASYGVLKYKIFMYDEEIELIQDLFNMINTLKRDFCLIWNMSFDIPYIIDRINELGFNPVDIMGSKDFKYPYLRYTKDTRNFDVKTRKDRFELSSYTVFTDQMTNYAKVRKGQAELESVRLNKIAQVELGDEKLDYSEDANIKTFAWKHYRKFVLYNIKDVLLQLGIERKTGDMDTIFLRAYDNATDYDSVFSQTIFLKNRVFLDYYRKLHLIKGNNININYNNRFDDEQAENQDTDAEYELDEDGEPDWTRPISKGFEGALVGDPLNNSYLGELLYGHPSMFVFSHVIDFDFSSMYPYIIISNNIGQNPLIGKVILKNKFSHLNGDPKNERYDAAKELFEDINTENFEKMGTRWFSLPTVDEIIEKIKKKG